MNVISAGENLAAYIGNKFLEYEAEHESVILHCFLLLQLLILQFLKLLDHSEVFLYNLNTLYGMYGGSDIDVQAFCIYDGII
ncbi:hypothetical protein RCL_jg23389.t1 [Rhizophagus clarus]|uniref:Uncharacterized protein n=1 Tax=Rhizophagus clarus TaxID=94130 RepID=A0A8H3QHM9_9GLOM|nr:hypothetical protein RCL_jg23389.t1 [Rhizophagus clarus]